MTFVRSKPQRIEALCRITKFTKNELKLIYQGFKQVNLLHNTNNFEQSTMRHAGRIATTKSEHNNSLYLLTEKLTFKNLKQHLLKFNLKYCWSVNSV